MRWWRRRPRRRCRRRRISTRSPCTTSASTSGRNFSARIEALSRAGYWDALIATAARLPLEKRAELYSLLWGGIDAFTRLFIDLARALEKLGFAQEARAELDCLVPRDRSIIDVDILSASWAAPRTRRMRSACVPLTGERRRRRGARRSRCRGRR